MIVPIKVGEKQSHKVSEFLNPIYIFCSFNSVDSVG